MNQKLPKVPVSYDTTEADMLATMIPVLMQINRQLEVSNEHYEKIAKTLETISNTERGEL